MNNFTIINLLGKILRTGSCTNPDDLMIQAQVDELVLNFLPDIDGATHWNFETRSFECIEEPQPDPDTGLTQEELTNKYWQIGAAYVDQFLNSDQKTQLLQISALDIPALAEVKTKIQTCITWITLMQADCLRDPKNFKPEGYGPCPYSYFEMYGEYLSIITPVLRASLAAQSPQIDP